MFPKAYFPQRYFAPRYWPKLGTVPTTPTLTVQDMTHAHRIDAITNFPLSADTPRDLFNDPHFVTPVGPLFW
jgi:hypothetical protein